MEKNEIRKLVNRFLDDDRARLEKAMRDGDVKPSEVAGVLDEMEKAETKTRRERIAKRSDEDLESLGREIAKNGPDDEGPPATDEELEAVGADIAKIANGEEPEASGDELESAGLDIAKMANGE